MRLYRSHLHRFLTNWVGFVMSKEKKTTATDFKDRITNDDFLMVLLDPRMPLADSCDVRLRHAMRTVRIDPVSLAQLVEFTETDILALMLGISEINPRIAKKFAPHLEVSAEWLAEGGNSTGAPIRNLMSPFGKRNKCCWSAKQWSGMIHLLDRMEIFVLMERFEALYLEAGYEIVDGTGEFEAGTLLLDFVRFQIRENDLLNALLQAVSGVPKGD